MRKIRGYDWEVRASAMRRKCLKSAGYRKVSPRAERRFYRRLSSPHLPTHPVPGRGNRRGRLCPTGHNNLLAILTNGPTYVLCVPRFSGTEAPRANASPTVTGVSIMHLTIPYSHLALTHRRSPIQESALNPCGMQLVTSSRE